MALYAVYLRKSRADLEAESLGQGETLARHRTALFDCAKRNGLEIGEVYEEIVSGDSIEARPQMLRLLSDVEKGRWAGVLCMDIDRLARGDSADQARISRTFRIANTLIITPARVYDTSRDSDEEYVDFELFMARREYKAISRRIMRGRIASAREGHFLGSTPPFGYDRVKAPRGYTLAPNADSDTVRLIFALCIEGLGCRAIAKRLSETGIPTRKGGLWSAATISDILKNPVYCGKIRWRFRREEKSSENGVVTRKRRENPDCILAEGLHPAIIGDEEFRKAQQLIATRKAPRNRKSAALQNPLAGLVYCGKCGRLMTRLGTGAKNRSPLLRCPNSGCDNVSAKLVQVENALAESLWRWLGGCRVSPCGTCVTDSEQAERFAERRLRAELSALEQRRERVFSLLEQGVYSPREFRERETALENRREQLCGQLARFSRPAENALPSRAENCPPQLPAKNNPPPKSIAEIYAACSPAEKNRLLKSIVSRVFYLKPQRDSKAARCGFTLEVLPLFPWEEE